MQGGWAHYPHLKSASRGGLARSSSLEGTSGEDAAANDGSPKLIASPYPLSTPLFWGNETDRDTVSTCSGVVFVNNTKRGKQLIRVGRGARVAW